MQHLRSYQLAVQFYRQAQGLSFPSHLKNQFQRAAGSIALNLAEGCGRRTRRDRLRFFQIAMGSIREVQAVFDLERSQISPALKDQLDHLAASTFKLIQNSPRP